MKKWIIFLVFTISIMLNACGNESASDDSETEIIEMESEEEEELEVEALNRTMIAKALGVEEDSRNIRFILGGLQTISAGEIQSAVYEEKEGNRIINIVAEDNTNYRIYLNKGGSVEAIENADTGEWPVRSRQ